MFPSYFLHRKNDKLLYMTAYQVQHHWQRSVLISKQEMQHLTVNSMDMLIGNIAGTIGETSVIAIVIGAIILILKGIIDLRIPGTYIVVTFVIFVGIFGHICRWNWILQRSVHDSTSLWWWSDAWCMVYGNRLCHFSDHTAKDRFVYGILSWMSDGSVPSFRRFCRRCSYAIIISNLLVPLIERVTLPKPFGKGGEK